MTAHSTLPGRTIAGRYELSSLIGQGGMGQVWTAYDQRLDRRVAVKLLHPDTVTGGNGRESQEAAQLRSRFVRECRVTAQVDHPGLVTVHDAGSDGDDLYLVMQHVDGIDLAGHLAQHGAEQRAYPWPWAVAVAAQLCAVLSAVHAVPIVHRDLKPRNVMVKQDGTLTVLDLGVAAVMDADTTRLTHTGSAVGSPAYMAPEQAMGGAVGPYTDLYALGVLLYELLSGSVPFTGQQVLGVLYRHLHEAPLPVRQLRPEIPGPLENLVMRLLAKDPQHRPGTAQDVYEELVPLLPVRGSMAQGVPGGLPPGAAGVAPTQALRVRGEGGPLDPSRPFTRPHAPWPDRNAGAAGYPPRPATPPAQAVGHTDVVAAVEEVKRLLGEGRITQAVDTLGGILPAAAAQHGEHSPVVRTLRKQYATTLMDDGQFRRALPELRRLADERAAEAGAGDPRSLRFRYDAAQCLEQLGDAAAALAEYRALLPYYENPYLANAYLPGDQAPGGRASGAYASGDGASGALLALDIRRRIGHLLLSLGDRTAAHDTLTTLLHDAQRQHGPGHPFPAEIQRTLQWLGQVLA